MIYVPSIFMNFMFEVRFANRFRVPFGVREAGLVKHRYDFKIVYGLQHVAPLSRTIPATIYSAATDIGRIKLPGIVKKRRRISLPRPSRPEHPR